MESHAFPPTSSTAEEWRQLLQETLGKEEGAAVAASLARPRDVVIINVTSSQDPALGQMCCTGTGLGTPTQQSGAANVVPITELEEPDSVLHVVAASGGGKNHINCAETIHARASHLLTTAATNGMGDTPLHCAARTGSTKMVACLIKLAKGVNGVDYDRARDLVRTRNKRGETALHEAIRLDKVKMVRDLMSADKELAQIDAHDGTSPLYLACSLGHVKIVRLILHYRDIEPSYSGPRGQNALHAAVLHHRKGSIRKLLLQRKKDLVKQRDTDGSTPLHFAASAKDPFLQYTVSVFSMNFTISYAHIFYIFSYFLPSKWMLTKVFERLGRPVIQLLAADPTLAFQPDNGGSFPVHIAASADCMVSLFVLLIRYPACARLRNAEGKTFLHVAVEKKRLIIVQFLCLIWGKAPFFKSTVNIQDHNGNTALHLAVHEGHIDICRLLIRNKHCNINLENRDGKTPMDLASGAVKSGFYFGLTAPRRILNMLTFANAQTSNRRRDLLSEYREPLKEDVESDKIRDFAQIVGIGSVLVSTATFTAALTMPGGVWSPGDASGTGGKKFVASPPALAGTPLFAGSSAFDGFVISNTLAFMCSTLATFSLVYCGVAAVDIHQRLQLVTFSLALLLCSARSFCAAFTFALYLLLAKVAHGTAIASIVMTSLALLDGVMFLRSSLNDMTVIIWRKSVRLLIYGPLLVFYNVIYPFWPYIVIFGYLLYDIRSGGKLHRPSRD